MYLKHSINNEQEFLRILIKLLEGMVGNSNSRLKIKESGLLGVWVKSCEESFSSKKNKEITAANEESKILYLELLCNLWKEYSS